MKKIWLFRHGEAEFQKLNGKYVVGRSTEVPLSETGKDQARQLGHWLVDNSLKPDAVYSSPAVRASQTGEIALATAGITVPSVPDIRLHEMSSGLMEGLVRAEVYNDETIKRIGVEQLDFKHAGGESMRETSARMYDWVQEVIDETEHVEVFAFTHQVAIRSLVGKLLDWDHPTIMQTQVANVAATTLTYPEHGGVPEVDFNISTLGVPAK